MQKKLAINGNNVVRPTISLLPIQYDVIICQVLPFLCKLNHCLK